MKRRTAISLCMVGASLCAVALAVLLSGCETQPTPFKEGVEVLPPHGCIDLRARGGQC